MNSSPFNPLGPANYHPLKSELQLPGKRCQRVGVLFATREGHTKRIAERIMSDLSTLGFDVDLLTVRHPFPFSLHRYCAAVLAASVHGGSHEKEMVRFVKEHRPELDGMTTAFVSVTLSEAGAEMIDKNRLEHEQFVRDVQGMLGKFFRETGWHPTLVKPVAGALLYTHYNFLVRLLMKNIARKAGASTDTSRDYDYTNWLALDKFVDEFAAEVRGKPDAGSPRKRQGPAN